TFHVGFAAHVAHDAQALDPERVQVAFGLRRAVLENVGDHHVGALARHRQSRRATEPTPAARDQRDLSLQLHALTETRSVRGRASWAAPFGAMVTCTASSPGTSPASTSRAYPESSSPNVWPMPGRGNSRISIWRGASSTAAR